MTKIYNDGNYIFEYGNITYKNKYSPYLEYKRNRMWNGIIDYIIKVINNEGIILKSRNKRIRRILTNNLSMWVASNLLENNNLLDPFFPHNAKNNDSFIKSFVFLGGISYEKALGLFNKFNLVKLCNQKIKELSDMKDKKFKVIRDKNRLFFIYKNRKIVVSCSDRLYKKLKSQYKGNNLNSDIFCVLMRYKTLMGNGHQFAMKTEFKDSLKKHYNIYFECFASAINCYYPMYCSLFYDIEKYFGSYGSFYLIKYIKGFYIANPPYDVYLLEKMVDKFISSIKNTDKNLSISYGLPNWGKYEKFEPLEKTKSSKYLTYFNCIEDRKVEWYDVKNNIKVRIPSHCRSVIQNEKGKKKSNIKMFDKLVKNIWY